MNNLEVYDRIIAVGVDMQNDFCPNGNLGVNEGDQVIEPFNQVADHVRKQYGRVILTADKHPKITDHFNKWPPHCVEGTFGAEFHKDLAVKPQDIVLFKGTGTKDDAYSGFEATNDKDQTIEKIITPKQAERVAVAIGGLAADYCVKETVLDACDFARKQTLTEKFDIYVIEDAVRAVNLNPNDGQEAIEEMKQRGAIFLTAQQIIEKLVTVKE